MHRTLLLLSALAFSALRAFAVDGQTLLNQTTILAAGGFPYKINQGGSFKLSGNLVPPGTAIAIEIEADNVTVDLNGFTIFGLSFAAAGTAGIRVDGVHALITNGVIDGFASPYIGNATDVTLLNVRSNVPVNGPVLLDQARLTAGGGSIAILQSGKYQFSSNLTGPGGTCGSFKYPCLIYVNAPNVTLDLAGFTLQITSPDIPILTGPAAKNLVVRNGIVSSTQVVDLILLPLIYPSTGVAVSYVVMEDLTLDGAFAQVLTAPYFVDRIVGPISNFLTSGNACPGVVSNSLLHNLQDICATSGQ